MISPDAHMQVRYRIWQMCFWMAALTIVVDIASTWIGVKYMGSFEQDSFAIDMIRIGWWLVLGFFSTLMVLVYLLVRKIAQRGHFRALRACCVGITIAGCMHGVAAFANIWGMTGRTL